MNKRMDHGKRSCRNLIRRVEFCLYFGLYIFLSKNFLRARHLTRKLLCFERGARGALALALAHSQRGVGATSGGETHDSRGVMNRELGNKQHPGSFTRKRRVTRLHWHWGIYLRPLGDLSAPRLHCTGGFVFAHRGFYFLDCPRGAGST